MRALRRPLLRAAGLAPLLVLAAACRSQVPARATAAAPLWDVDRVEILHWNADDPAFAQDMAVEASGLASSGRVLYVALEKYARVLAIDLEQAYAARVLRVDVPPFSELEGIAVAGSTAYLCDEAHAAVYEVDLAAPAGAPLRARQLALEGVAVEGGKIGFEGIEVDRDGTFYLLLERGSAADGACVSTIFRLRRSEGRLVAEGDPIVIRLEDCAWRLSGLALWRGSLLALKTQYPGNQYQVIAIDPASGSWRVDLELTGLLRSVTESGWGNNVEGIAATGDGSLFLVADNAVTGVVSASKPPPARERTLFLRLPPTVPAPAGRR